MKKNEENHITETPFGYTLSLISGKWKMIILYLLAEYEVIRYNELKRKIEVKKVLASGMTFERAKVMRLGFDDGTYITCTPNHKFMTRKYYYDKEAKRATSELLCWVEAKDMELGDRVKSNHLVYSPNGYLRFSNGGEFVHRMVYEYFSGKSIPDGYVIHHIDEDKVNNNIDNLILMNDAEHRILHMKDTIRKYCYKSEEVMGENNPFYGKKHSDETKSKISFTKRLQNFKNKLTNEDLIKLFNSGKTLDEICDIYNVKLNHIFYL